MWKGIKCSIADNNQHCFKNLALVFKNILTLIMSIKSSSLQYCQKAMSKLWKNTSLRRERTVRLWGEVHCQGLACDSWDQQLLSVQGPVVD